MTDTGQRSVLNVRGNILAKGKERQDNATIGKNLKEAPQWEEQTSKNERQKGRLRQTNENPQRPK